MDKLLEFLADLTNTAVSELKEKLTKKKDSDEIDWEKSVSTVKKLADAELKRIGDGNIGRGTKEALTKAEKKIKEKYNVSGSDLMALVDAVFTDGEKKGAENSKVELTKENAKDNPIVKELIAQIHTDRNKEVDDLKSKLEATEKELSTEKSRSANEAKVKKITQIWIKEINPVLAEEGTKLRERQIATFQKEIDPNMWEVNGDKVTPLNSDGKPLTDDRHRPIDTIAKLDSLNFLPKHKEDASKSSGGVKTKTSDGDKGGKKDLPTPKSWKEFNEILDDPSNGYTNDQIRSIHENTENYLKENTE